MAKANLIIEDTTRIFKQSTLLGVKFDKETSNVVVETFAQN